MPTHKPATPLPASAPLPWIVQADHSQYNIVHAEDARVASLHFERTIAAQKMAASERAHFIAHAANAYPRLVEALHRAANDLRSWRKQASGQIKEPIRLQVQTYEDQMRAILRDLGEL